MFEAAVDSHADPATVSEAPRSVARWDDEAIAAVAYIRRPRDGVIRAGVALGERSSSGISPLSEADDPWKDMDEELTALREGPPRLLPFAWLAEELGGRFVVVTWGIASPAIETVAVADRPDSKPTRVAATTRLFVTGTWVDHDYLLALENRGGLPLHGLSPDGAVIARSRTETA